jgi:hypothetical protein
MSTPAIDTILERIAKLSELTLDNGATEAEANLAATKIQELLNKYNLSMDQVKPMKQNTSRDVAFEQLKRENTRMFDWELRLADAMMVACGVRYVYTSAAFTFIGLPNDVQLAKSMYVQFRALALAMAKRATQEYASQFFNPRSLRGSASLRNFRLSYLVGFTQGLASAFRLAQRKDDQASQIQALVLVKDAIIQTAIEEKYPKLGKPRNYSSMGNATAERQGYSDGKASANRKSLEG